MVNIKDLLNIAVRVEADGFSYYKKMERKSTGKIKDFFAWLADQERDHEKIFKSMIDNSEENKGTSYNEALGYLNSYASISIIPKLSREDVPVDFKEAVKAAMEVEKDSIVFYTELSELVPGYKEEFEKIINEERKHLKKLINLYEEKWIKRALGLFFNY